MSFKHIQAVPTAGALGAEIRGLNLNNPLSDEVFAEVHQAFLDHLVIFIRNQDITPDQQKAFAKKFGELDIHEYIGGLEGHPELIPIVKEKDDDGYNFGGRWHADVTYQKQPALGSVLYGIDIPAYGGDTLWANQYLAYQTLSDGMKRMLEGLRVVHSPAMSYGNNGFSADAGTQGKSYMRSMEFKNMNKAESGLEDQLHPAVCTHPETGRKHLFVNSVYCVRFEDMTIAESKPLLSLLYKHASQEAFTCRFRWENGSIVVWDNRCTQHFALNDYHGRRREMHRATITGTVPAA